MAKGSVKIVAERCKGCGFCVEFCPTHVLALSSALQRQGIPSSLHRVTMRNAAAATSAGCTAPTSRSSDTRRRPPRNQRQPRRLRDRTD